MPIGKYFIQHSCNILEKDKNRYEYDNNSERDIAKVEREELLSLIIRPTKCILLQYLVLRAQSLYNSVQVTKHMSYKQKSKSIVGIVTLHFQHNLLSFVFIGVQLKIKRIPLKQFFVQ